MKPSIGMRRHVCDLGLFRTTMSLSHKRIAIADFKQNGLFLGSSFSQSSRIMWLSVLVFFQRYEKRLF